MKNCCLKIIGSLFCVLGLNIPSSYGAIYEGVGIFSNSPSLDINLLQTFLPYNPLILEVGAFRGNGAIWAAKVWPKSRVIAFEPDPYAYMELEKNVLESQLTNIEYHNLAACDHNGVALFNVCLGPNNNEPAYGYASSLLPIKDGMEVYCKGPKINVNCVDLDSWCAGNGIEKIDVLRLEVEGAELQVLYSSSNVLKKTQIIYVKTYIHPYRKGATKYPDLKKFLENSNFVLIAHHYEPEMDGHAIFLSRELFDAYFKKSLGMLLEK